MRHNVTVSAPSDRSLFHGRDAYEVLQVRPDAHHLVIQAAFRALAALRHPDSDASPHATARMAELNDAYSKIRTPERRAAYDRLRVRGAPASAEQQPTVVVPPVPSRTTRASAVVDFGRYAGWTIADLARQDPEYLEWLSRHSSGIRYRAEIATVLDGVRAAAAPQPAKRR